MNHICHIREVDTTEDNVDFDMVVEFENVQYELYYLTGVRRLAHVNGLKRLALIDATKKEILKLLN